MMHDATIIEKNNLYLIWKILIFFIILIFYNYKYKYFKKNNFYQTKWTLKYHFYLDEWRERTPFDVLSPNMLLFSVKDINDK